VPFRWPGIVADLEAGRFDVAVGGVTVRPERAVVGEFTRPVARAGAVVLVRPGTAAVETPGFRLAVNASGHLERVARRLFPDATLVTTTDNRALAALVRSGAADGVLTDEVEAETLALPDAVRRGPYTRDAKAYLGSDPTLVADLDAWLRAREADGTLAALRGRWLGAARADRRDAFESDLDALLAAIDLRLGFMPAVAAAKRDAGRPVDDPAQEARVLAATRDWARGAGVDADSVATLFRALIDAAKRCQQAFLARPWPVDRLDLEREARPALARVSREIVARAAAAARAPDLARRDPADVARGLDPSLVDAEGSVAIARTVVALRPSTPARTAFTGCALP
jgi:cyclohexadienyl dehydratase